MKWWKNASGDFSLQLFRSRKSMGCSTGYSSGQALHLEKGKAEVLPAAMLDFSGLIRKELSLEIDI